MEDVVGIVLAFFVGGFIGELAFVEVVEEAIVGHDVVGVERADHGALHFGTHLFINYNHLLPNYTYKLAGE